MTVSLARRGVSVEVTLHTVVTYAREVYLTALHKQELATRDTVSDSGKHVDDSVFRSEVLPCLYAVLYVARDIERALLRKLCVTLDVKASLLRTARGIRQSVHGTLHHLHLDALAVLHVYCGTAVFRSHVGKGKSVELYRSLVGA